MSEALSSLGTIFTSGLGGSGGGGGVPGWMQLLLGGLAGTGEVGNILAGRQKQDALNNLTKKENAFTSLTPQQLSAKVAAATQPLSAGLTQEVGNVVQGEIGERGLSQAPGIFSADLSQSLAPFYQQNQQTALQQILAQMQLPISEAGAQAGLLPGQTNLAPILALLMKSFSPGTIFATGGGAGSPQPPPPQTPTNSGLLSGILQGITSDVGGDMPTLGG